MQELKKAASENPQYPYSFSQMAEALLQAGKPHEALSWMGKAHTLDRKFLWAWRDPAARGRYAQGVESLRRILKESPHEALAQAWMGKTRLEEGALEQALAHLDEAVRLSPRLLLARLWRGQGYFQSRKFLAAASDFSRALELDADYGYAAFWLGRACLNLGQTGQALEALEAAIALDPFNVHPLGYLYRGLARCQQDDLGGGLKDFENYLWAVGSDPRAEALRDKVLSSLRPRVPVPGTVL
jgi:tetratricopeptide (TPR) repeat protein